MAGHSSWFVVFVVLVLIAIVVGEIRNRDNDTQHPLDCPKNFFRTPTTNQSTEEEKCHPCAGMCTTVAMTANVDIARLCEKVCKGKCRGSVG